MSITRWKTILSILPIATQTGISVNSNISGRKLMKGNKSKENKPESVESVWEKAFGDMCKGLDAYGPREILNLLVENARHDEIVLQLLLRFPTVVVLGEFLSTLPPIKVTKREFKKLQKTGCV